LKPASQRASGAARGSSKKSGTRCELLLRRALWKRGLRYRLNVPGLAGRPDIVFLGARVVVFCDGDFWHGRDWQERCDKLAVGHNAAYWLKKIGGNIERDLRATAALEETGWTVLRFWETDIVKDVEGVVQKVVAQVEGKRNPTGRLKS